jgi:predicted permease
MGKNLLQRLLFWFRRDRLDDDLAEEMRLHIELRQQALIDAGLDPESARVEARRQFGNVSRKREESRDFWGFPALDTIAQDVKYSFRLLRRSPGFAAVAILALGIGIGAAAAVFNLVDAVLLRKLPVANPDELVILRWRTSGRMPMVSLTGNFSSDEHGQFSTSFSLPTFETLRAARPAGARVVGFAGYMTFNVAIDGPAESGTAQAVSGNYFDVLGVQPAAGRLLTESDDRPEAPAVAVISERFWRSRLGGDPAVVGRGITLNGVPVTVVGVMARGFASTLQVGEAPSITVPLALRATLDRSPGLRTADHWWVLMMARLPRGASQDDARRSLESVLRQSVADGHPQLTAADLPSLDLLPGARGQLESRDNMRDPLRIMALIVVIVLLVACAIVANLLIARGQVRVRELTVRVAIGAPRARVVRQLITEGLLLALLASALGLLVARWIAAALTPALDGSNDFILALGADWRMLGFMAAIATLSTALFAVLPALRSTAIDLARGLQEQPRTQTAARKRRRLSQALVVVQVALSILLLTVAALLVRSVLNLRATPTGFDPRNILTFQVDPTRNGYQPERVRTIYSDALERLSALPGVRSASLMSNPLIGAGGASTIAAPPEAPALELGSPEARAFFQNHRTFLLTVNGDFFRTMSIPIVRGRTFSSVDGPNVPTVAIVNEALAQQLFGTTDAIGRRFKTDLRKEAQIYEVIGVCANTRIATVRRGPQPIAYFNYRQRTVPAAAFAVKTVGDPLAIADAAREAIRQVDPNLPVNGLRTQEMQIERSLRSEQLLARLAVVLGLTTLLLSGVGLFGLLAYDVARRGPEIGLRMALGAGGNAVRWMVIRQSLILTAFGLAVGIPSALACTRVLQRLLFGLTPTDPSSILVASALMGAAGVAAAYLPALRASRVDPMTALRTE